VGKEPNAPPVWRGGLPFFGHFLRFAANPLAVIREGYAKHGPVFTLRFLHYSMTFLVGTAAHTPFFRAGAFGGGGGGGGATVASARGSPAGVAHRSYLTLTPLRRRRRGALPERAVQVHDAHLWQGHRV
jgi:hypothetical protein